MPTLFTNDLKIVDLVKPYEVKPVEVDLPKDWKRALLFYHGGQRDFRDVMNFRDKIKFIWNNDGKAEMRMLLSDLEDSGYEREIYCFHQGDWFKVFSDARTLTFLQTDEAPLELQDGDVLLRLRHWAPAYDTLFQRWMAPYKMAEEMKLMYKQETDGDLNIPLPLNLQELVVSLTKKLIEIRKRGERMELVTNWLEDCELSSNSRSACNVV